MGLQWLDEQAGIFLNNYFNQHHLPYFALARGLNFVQGSVIKNWKRRFFVLSTTGTGAVFHIGSSSYISPPFVGLLAYYDTDKSQSGSEKPKGAINLAECTSIKLGNDCSWDSKGVKGVLDGSKLEVVTLERKLCIFCDTPIEATVL